MSKKKERERERERERGEREERERETERQRKQIGEEKHENVCTFKTVLLTIFVAKIYRPRWLLTIYMVRKFLNERKLNRRERKKLFDKEHNG